MKNLVLIADLDGMVALDIVIGVSPYMELM